MSSRSRRKRARLEENPPTFADGSGRVYRATNARFTLGGVEYDVAQVGYDPARGGERTVTRGRGLFAGGKFEVTVEGTIADASGFAAFMRKVAPEWRWPLRPIAPSWMRREESEHEQGWLTAGRGPLHDGEILLWPIVMALSAHATVVVRDEEGVARAGPGPEVYPPWVVAGETEPGVLRVHRLGRVPVPLKELEGLAKDLAPWVMLDHEPARCLLHDDCAGDDGLGRACWAASRKRR